WHHHLCLRVPHAAVIFYHAWIIAHFYQACKYETLINYLLILQPPHRRLNNPLLHLLHKCIICKGHWRNGTHPTSIRSGISFANPLVVFGLRQYHIVLPIAHRKNRKLYSGQEFLHHHLLTCLPKLGFLYHHAEGLHSFFSRSS